MKNNLFTYATKELSQDAFICWLLANYDTDALQEESYRFLNMLMGKNFSLGDIKMMSIKQQERQMDIVIDFWTEIPKTSASHYVLVVEDKTTSSAHDGQLVKYNKIIDGWNKEEPGFELRTKKVFLKSNFLSQEDKNEIAKANDNTLIQWAILDIEDLYKGFFADVKQTKSEIFDTYVEYFNKLYKDLNFSPTSEPLAWNFYNWMRFFESFFKIEYKTKYPDSWCETSIYRGMYPSFRVVFPLIRNCEFYANFEIVPREKLIPYLHPGFRYDHTTDGKTEDRWVWSVKEIVDNKPFEELSNRRLAALRDYVSKNGRRLFSYSGKSRSFAKIDKDKHISYKDKTIQELTADLRGWLDSFFDILLEYRKTSD